MPANLFLVPLLAGYLFVHISNRFRFRAQSLDGYRLLIESAIAGIVLLAISRILVLGLGWLFPDLPNVWHRSVVPDAKLAYLGTAIGSVILGFLIPAIDNRRPRLGIGRQLARRVLCARKMRVLRKIVRGFRRAYQENRRIARDSEIRMHGNGLTRFLHDAATYGILVSITLASRKWYVGYIAEAVNLEPKESCFRMLPLLSGYRHRDTLQFVRQVCYLPVYRRVQEEHGSLKRYVVTLSLQDVRDAREFDLEIGVRHLFFGIPDRP